jgi:hypothetical protein
VKRELPIPLIIALAVLLAGGIGIWRALSQPPAEQGPLKPPIEGPGSTAFTVDPKVPQATEGSIAGVVLMPDGKPAAGAKVHAQISAYVGKPSITTRHTPEELDTLADAQGHFTFEVSLDWSWTLRAQKDALGGVKADVMPPEPRVTIQLLGSQKVTVTVREKNGQGLSAIPVGLTADGQNAVSFEGATDGSGRVLFDSVPHGKWRADAVEFVVDKDGAGKPLSTERRRGRVEFVVDPSAPADVVLELGAVGKIRGRVTAPAGTDLTQLSVFAVPAAVEKAMHAQPYQALMRELPTSFPSARPSADGRFELADVSGSKALIVPHPSLVHPSVIAEPDGAEVTVALAKDKAVKGKVVDADGKPLARFAVNGAEYNAPDGSFEYSPWGATLVVRPKHLPLVVTADGYQPLEKQIDLGEGENDVGTLQLQRGRTFTLKVVDEQTGSPVEDVTFARLDATALSVEPATIIAPGVYRFSRLPSTDTTLSLTRYGGATRKVQVGATETEKIFRFGAGATLRGTVLGPNGKPAVGARVFPSGDMRATQLTNSEGMFVMPGLEPGQLTMVVMFGRASSIKKVTIPDRGEVELKVELGERPE